MPLLETSFGDPPVVRSLRLVTGMLRRKLLREIEYQPEVSLR